MDASAPSSPVGCRGMSMTTRTITTRVLLARAREHGRVLRTLGDGVEWSVLTWSQVVGDPEWVYHLAAREACTMAATRFLAGARSLRDHGLDDLSRPGGGAPWRVFGRLGGARQSHLRQRSDVW